MDYYSNSYNVPSQFLIRNPPFSPKKVLEIIRNDPVVKGAIITLVDKAMEGNWGLRGRDKKSRDKELERKLRQVKFDQVIRKVLFNLFLYNNAFIEIVKKGEELSDLNVLETSLMEIKAKDNGDILGYEQNIGARENNPKWSKEQIVYIKMDDLNNNVWSEFNIQSLYDTILLKDAIRQWLRWFFMTNQMRGVYAIKSTNDTKVKEFISYLKASEKDVTRPVVLQGEVTYQTLNDFAEKGKSIQDLLTWCDQQMLMLIQVPPIAIGLPDSSGRSNSVEQNQSLNTRVKSAHKLLEEAFTYDLFPLIGFDKVEFTYGLVDNVVMEQVVNTIMIMRNAMFTEEAMKEYLDNMGITFNTTNIFKKPEEMMAEQMEQKAGLDNKEVGTGNEGSIGNKSADSAPSRMRQTNSTVSKGSSKQIIQNAKFKGYPYEYDVK